MKKYSFNLLLLLLFCFLCTSCFEIKEELTLKKDGSGTYSFTMDMSQLKQVFIMSQAFAKGFSSMDTSGKYKPNMNFHNPMLNMKIKFDQLKYKLEEIKGITNYEVVYDTSLYLIGAKYNFSNITALNASVNELQKDQEEKQEDHYKYNGRVFERYNSISENDVKIGANNDSIARSMLGTARYHIIYHFEEPVKDFENENYYMSRDRKTLIFTAPLMDLVDRKVLIDNKVKF
ncbi:MAG TPA: hypothetical protein VIK89_03620 [Cytophagaceae bacterium]